MRSYYNRAEELTLKIKEGQEVLKEAQEELANIMHSIALYEELPASSGGKVKVQVTKTYKETGKEPVTTKHIDWVDYEIYAASQEVGASEMPPCLMSICGLESASVTLERIED